MAKPPKSTLWVIIRAALVLTAVLFASGLPALAQPLAVRQPPPPPCRLAPGETYHDHNLTCLEVVYEDGQPPEAVPSLMGLAFAPDNTLYMARTAAGEIWAMRDADGDQYMDEPRLVAADLDLPVALAVYEKSLFVLTAQQVIRLDDADGDGLCETQTRLVDHLSDEQGWWPGSIGVGSDQRLYVTTGASCDDCEPSDPRRGALLSFALDGTDERIEASGLHHPTDFAWQPESGDLWIADSQLPLDLSGAKLSVDELNRFESGADYSFQPPTLTFDAGSTPSGLAFYNSDAYPVYKGTLLVTLHGSWGLPAPSGYAVVVISFGSGTPVVSDIIAPISENPANRLPVEEYSILGLGIFPEHPADIAVSAEGWIYVSLEEGRILRFRPSPQTP